jgi:hypothetical protein
MKLISMASVYIVFPCHACECVILLSSGNKFLHFSWNNSVINLCIFSWKIYRHPIPVVSGCITFSMVSISTQQVSSFCSQWKDGDGQSGCMNFFHQHGSTTFHHMCWLSYEHGMKFIIILMLTVLLINFYLYF